jgi:hypothetical protein
MSSSLETENLDDTNIQPKDTNLVNNNNVPADADAPKKKGGFCDGLLSFCCCESRGSNIVD